MEMDTYLMHTGRCTRQARPIQLMVMLHRLMAVIDLVPAACTVELAASLHSQDRSRPLHAPWRMATDRSHEKTRRTRDDSSTLKRGGEQSGSATSLLVTRSGTPPVEFRSSSRRVVASLPVDVRLHSASRKSSVWPAVVYVSVSVLR